jgi:hypothetical protein
MSEDRVLLIQKDSSDYARKDFVKRFNNTTGGEFNKLVSNECTIQIHPLYLWDFSQGDDSYRLEWHAVHETYILYASH